MWEADSGIPRSCSCPDRQINYIHSIFEKGYTQRLGKLEEKKIPK